jgi:hypothetical protein
MIAHIRTYIIAVCCCSLIQTAVALPKYGTSTVMSPNGDYKLVLSDTTEPFVYRLTIMLRNLEITQYMFKGELVTAYWSPSGEYVALNNHYGRGWYPWIIRLKDGTVLRSSDPVHTSTYDRYSDAQCTPDILAAATNEIRQVYPAYKNDQMRNGYSTVAYEWKDEDRLLIFHELIFDDLFLKEDSSLQVFSVFIVRGSRLIAEDFHVEKVSGEWWKQYPPEVKKTLQFDEKTK